MSQLRVGLLLSHFSAKPLKEKGSGVEARAEGPFLKWQNHGSKATEVLGEREDPRPPPKPP